jgi:hypothetical protein
MPYCCIETILSQYRSYRINLNILPPSTLVAKALNPHLLRIAAVNSFMNN